MGTAVVLDREEYVEQTYFFRAFRERLADNLAAQELLERLHPEILATTRLPYALQFLATEIKHTGQLSTGFARLSHYFAPFQTYLVRQTEVDARRFSLETALLVLEREAAYRATPPSPQGMFFYQFEAICRNRLGYDDGLTAMSGDPIYNDEWCNYLELVRKQLGSVDFADLVFLRSDQYVADQRRQQPDYIPPVPPLFGDKEGKIAKAHRGRDPLYLFAALQRQLGYPEVPRYLPRDDLAVRLEVLKVRFRELEQRLSLVEGEVRGQVDLSKFGKPELLQDQKDDED
jgi:hypothetical protein